VKPRTGFCPKNKRPSSDLLSSQKKAKGQRCRCQGAGGRRLGDRRAAALAATTTTTARGMVRAVGSFAPGVASSQRQASAGRGKWCVGRDWERRDFRRGDSSHNGYVGYAPRWTGQIHAGRSGRLMGLGVHIMSTCRRVERAWSAPPPFLVPLPLPAPWPPGLRPRGP
jgi:hypothetical protein